MFQRVDRDGGGIQTARSAGRLIRYSAQAGYHLQRSPTDAIQFVIPARGRNPGHRLHDHGSHPLRPQPHRLPPHRRRAHRALLLGVRAEARRHVHPAHRGHRPRALDRSNRCRRSSTAWTGWASTTRARTSRWSGSSAIAAVAEQLMRAGPRLLRLREQGRARRAARAAARARREAALRRALAAREREARSA